MVRMDFTKTFIILKIMEKGRKRKEKKKRKTVTMREYNAYRIQQRPCEANTLICGGQLFQQYVIDAFTTIEEERLRWV